MTSTPPAFAAQMAWHPVALGCIWLLAQNDTLLAAGLADDETQAELLAQQAARSRGLTPTIDSNRLQTLASSLAQWLDAPAATEPNLDGWRLQPQGTPFQQAVWQQLQQIPVGTTLSYTELAQRLGRASATRAVASACGANPLAVLVPCHRVVRRDGSLGGYRWGLERKRQLLARESFTERSSWP